jgi:hypothetical protein
MPSSYRPCVCRTRSSSLQRPRRQQVGQPLLHVDHPRHQYVLLVLRRRGQRRRLSARPPGKRQIVAPVSREQYVAGLFTSVLMHERGHALFDPLDIPVFGRGEDAPTRWWLSLRSNSTRRRRARSSRVSPICGRSRGTRERRRWTSPIRSSRPIPSNNAGSTPFCAFSDEHGTSSQRLYNTLCIAYGGDPVTFQDFVDSGWLPPERAKNCAREYQQIKFAFEKTILPLADQEQMAKVRDRQWFTPAELQEK